MVIGIPHEAVYTLRTLATPAVDSCRKISCLGSKSSKVVRIPGYHIRRVH